MKSFNEITLKSISELLEFRFYIPHFQRGYRWKPRQVTDLLDDIWEFTQKEKKQKEEFYCLQPIVVKKVDDKFIVIDGQQRLTTIYIILSFLDDIMKILGKNKFTLEYETRSDAEDFLKNIDLNKKDSNIDYFHICQAYNTIKDWFTNKDGTIKINILNTLLKENDIGNNVQVIWYKVNDSEDIIEIFTRLNIGKIPLTNAELIKALFLTSDNFTGTPETIRLKQLEIASEWDRIEYELRNEDFWFFLCDLKDEYDNRIEFIFDLMAEKKSKDKDFTFRFFNERFKTKKDPEAAWLEIKKYFLTFQEWFNNKELYHLAGYLITIGHNIKQLKNNADNKTKTQFKEYLKEKIEDSVKYDILGLTYPDDRNLIGKVLLLFNIISLVNLNNSNSRFQFGRYKNENWDIEHIHAVQSEMPLRLNEQKDWLKDVIKFISDVKLKERAIQYLSNDYKDHSEIFKTIYVEIVNEFNINGEGDEINDLSNLTILDSGTNRGYKNAVFPVKRQKIIEKDQNGTFIPLCTKNVFLKYYNASVDQMTLWDSNDRQSYIKTILTTLAPFIQIQKSKKNE